MEELYRLLLRACVFFIGDVVRFSGQAEKQWNLSLEAITMEVEVGQCPTLKLFVVRSNTLLGKTL